LNRPFPARNSPPSASFVRINGKIRAREVRVIGPEGNQLGVIALSDAMVLARQHGVDLVEIAPNAVPPVCRLVDFGKFRYEQAKKDKESKKHQHANKVKEVQLSPKIDPHDLSIKTTHAIGFLCEDMKVKASLKFRGREMAHTEFGFQVINKFITDVSPYGHPDFAPKLIGRGINVMISPLPRAKRAKNPNQTAGDGESEPAETVAKPPKPRPASAPNNGETSGPSEGFSNNPFGNLDVK
jgi:translation initiation factor IF-3